MFVPLFLIYIGVYPELYQGGHAVIERHLQKSEV